jgi:hypothetical protein
MIAEPMSGRRNVMAIARHPVNRPRHALKIETARYEYHAGDGNSGISLRQSDSAEQIRESQRPCKSEERLEGYAPAGLLVGIFHVVSGFMPHRLTSAPGRHG